MPTQLPERRPPRKDRRLETALGVALLGECLIVLALSRHGPTAMGAQAAPMTIEEQASARAPCAQWAP